MSNAAIIINPRSGRGKGKGLQLAQALKASHFPDAHMLLLDDFAKLEPTLTDYAARGIENLFISSGDGTIQAIQTWLAESGAFKSLPHLCLLPHGTTNMTAADLGFQRKSIEEQARFIAQVSPRELRKRHTVRVVNPRDRKPLHGMFFGTGAVSEATRYCQRIFNDRGVHGSYATFATLASAVGKSIFTKPDPNDPDRFDKPYPIAVNANGSAICSGQNLLMLATTLDKLILSSRPFWGGATAPMRITIMPYPIPSVVRWLVPSLYGGEDRTAPPGAISRAVNSCDVTCPVPFVIDGEFYAAPDDQPLKLELGPSFEYITA
jgi:diacylglycerol kinase (ATP)